MRTDITPYRFRSISFIAEDVAPGNVYLTEQRYGMFRIMIVAGAEQKSQRIAKAIHQSMNLRIPAAPGYTNRFIS